MFGDRSVRAGVSLRVILLSLALVCGCGDPKGGGIGDPCEQSAECSSGVCVDRRCTEAEGDADRDGLSNELEVTLGTNPLSADTDGDGKADGDELGGARTPPYPNADGDALIDALESSLRDNDGDCLPDEGDPEDEVVAANLAALVPKVCPSRGVCADAAERRAMCEEGVPRCVLEDVDGWEASETRCDGRDNDCDGGTDEGVGCESDDPCREGHCAGAAGCTSTPVLGRPTCDDGDACTVGERCESGRCGGGEAVGCDDGNPCTEDVCDPKSGCSYPFANGACDDGDPCSVGDACSGGLCVSSAYDCDDRLACTEDACDGGGGCTHELRRGHCLVGGVCAVEGERDPLDPCRACAPAASAEAWSVVDGLSCDADGDPCTVADACLGGMCVPGEPLACPDEAGGCRVGRCVDGEGGPACTTVVVDDGRACTDADPCTTGDTCVAGACVGVAVLTDCAPLGVDEDCDGRTDEDCAFVPSVAADALGGGGGVVSDGALRAWVRVAPVPFHGPATDGEFVVRPGVPAAAPRGTRAEGGR